MEKGTSIRVVVVKRLLLIIGFLILVSSVSATTYTSRYPDAYNTNTIKTTTIIAGGYEGFLSTDPSKSLTGSQVGNQWVSNSKINERFHFDLNASGAIVRRIYYENSHYSGGSTNVGSKNFTFWGSNSSESFNTLVYANNTGWTQLTAAASQFDEHVALNQADPKYILVTNTQAYRYYAIKIENGWGAAASVAFRRITMQTEDGYVPGAVVPPIPSFTSNVTSGYTPLAVQFNDTSITTPTAWNWSYTGTSGGNTTQTWWSQIQNATGLFTTGNYTIHLNVTNASGFATTASNYWINVSAPTITAAFSGTPLGGLAGTNVAFTSTNGTYVPDNWTWNFGDGNTSTSQNPSHPYDYNGNFNVNLTVYNATAGFDSELKSGYVVISDSGGLSGWNQQDILMEGAYSLQVAFQDSSTHNPIPIVNVIDSNGYNTSTTVGTFTNTYNYSVVVLYISSSGYLSTSRSYVMDEDKTVTVYLTAYTPQATQNPQQNTLWSPPQVVFQVLDNNNNPIVGTPVYASAVWTTLPGGLAGAIELFQSAFGLSNATAAMILNSTTNYVGTTDSSGSVVFMMVPVIQYNITARDTNGINYTITIMPKDQYYQIKTQNASFENQALKEIAYINNSRTSIFNTSFYEPANGTIGVMGAEIYDSTGQTAGANCWWTLLDNETTWWDNRSWALGSGLQVINKTVVIVPYQQWEWGCTTL
jgi:PKD repeat protein